MPDQAGLAQYACDYCKSRKCETCKDAKTICVYSRRGKIRRRPRVGQVLTINQSWQLAEKEAHSRYRASSETQTQAAPARTNKHLESPGSNGDLNDSSGYTDSPGQILNEDSSSPFYLGPSTTATFLSQANSDIDKLKTSFGDPNLRSHAQDSLSELSNAFATAHFSNTSDIRRSVREFRRKSEVFFIPSQEEGLQLMEIFQKGIAKGTPFFNPAPPTLLSRVIFQPSTVQERGWLLLVNSFLATTMTFINPSNTTLIRGLQRNIWMLIEDSSIFLEPSEITIQAIIILATHSEEITTPGLCWTMISHACQMAHTLALHLPTSRAPMGSELYLRRNFIFWGLFVLDKGLSLSFGRPPMLPAYLYQNVPPPDPKHMVKLRPHLKSTPNDVIDDFGCFFILTFRELAIIQGKIGESMHRKEDARTSVKLREDLEMWMARLKEQSVVVQGMRRSDQEEDLEICIGIDFLVFQYHHLTIYLNRADKEPRSQAKCLASARAAIPLLESLVSATSQVFNGLVWQLLYQPFMPFFVIFSNIIADPLATTSFKDLGLLRNVVLYFLQMHNNHPSSKRLEKVAETFTQLAEAYVRRAMSLSKGDCKGMPSPPLPLEQNSNNDQISTKPLGFSSSATSPLVQKDFVPVPPGIKQASLKRTVFSPLFNFRDISSDPVALLNFLGSSSSITSPSYNHNPTTTHSDQSTTTSDFDSDSPNHMSARTHSPPPPLLNNPNPNPNGNLNPISPALASPITEVDKMDFSSDSILQHLKDFEQNYGFDTSFDWLSWGESDWNM